MKENLLYPPYGKENIWSWIEDYPSRKEISSHEIMNGTEIFINSSSKVLYTGTMVSDPTGVLRGSVRGAQDVYRFLTTGSYDRLIQMLIPEYVLLITYKIIGAMH